MIELKSRKIGNVKGSDTASHQNLTEHSPGFIQTYSIYDQPYRNN